MSGYTLAHYDAARRELALATKIDEVKDIRDKAVAMQVYAKLAKDEELLQHAQEIKERAEIRAGEMLIEMNEKGERSKPGDWGRARDLNPSSGALRKRKARGTDKIVRRSTLLRLVDLGISREQSSLWQRKARAANGIPKKPPVPRKPKAIKRARKPSMEVFEDGHWRKIRGTVMPALISRVHYAAEAAVELEAVCKAHPEEITEEVMRESLGVIKTRSILVKANKERRKQYAKT